MRIRLLTSLKYRVPGEGSKYLNPGIYDTNSPDFPEALRGESRLGVVEILDGPVSPALLEESTESTDAYDEANDDIGEGAVEEEIGKEVVEEEAEEEAEEEKPAPKKPGRPKKETIKRRG